MTSDAKVGLLLGLVFIFVIAFIINGLPQLNRHKNSNELTTMGSTDIQHLEILSDSDSGRIERSNSRRPRRRPRQSTTATSRKSDNFAPPSRPLGPDNDTDSGRESNSRYAIDLPTPATDQEISTPRSLKTLSKTYTVRSGDNLSKISTSCYGPVEGNKYENIKKIAKANNLESQDLIYEGMELEIPPLAEKKSRGSILQSGMFEKVESISPRLEKKKEELKKIVVEKNDSLWKIASKHLGNPNRYKEIVKLNPQIKNENSLPAGMKISLPEK